jgi:hypothetical protein
MKTTATLFTGNWWLMDIIFSKRHESDCRSRGLTTKRSETAKRKRTETLGDPFGTEVIEGFPTRTPPVGSGGSCSPELSRLCHIERETARIALGHCGNVSASRQSRGTVVAPPETQSCGLSIRPWSHRLFIGNDSGSTGNRRACVESMRTESHCRTRKVERIREASRASVCKSVGRGFEPRPPPIRDARRIFHALHTPSTPTAELVAST